VDQLVPLPDLGTALPGSARGPRLAVNLHGRGPESHRLLLAAEPERLIAFANAEAGVAGPPWRDDEHEVARWCRLLSESGIPADPGRLSLAPPPGPAPPGTLGATLIHPGAGSPARRWPPERFAAVAAAERRAGRTVLVSGSPGERPLAMTVARLAGLPDEAVVAGRTDLLGLARLVAAAGRLVVGDTGVSHLATALGTPSVTLFGPVSPALWGPPPGRPLHRALWAGRSGDPHGRRPDPGLLRIGVGEVLDALAALDRAQAPVGRTVAITMPLSGRGGSRPGGTRRSCGGTS
jgi:hypothetical protein